MPRSYKWDFSKAQKPDKPTMLWLYEKYVLDCPVSDVSRRGRDFHTLGWEGAKFCTLKSQMQKHSGLTRKWWIQTENKYFIAEIEKLHLIETYPVDYEFAIYAKGNKQKVEGLFYLIRNSLAHGSFRYHNTKAGEYLAFETRKGEELRGRALLKIDTLKIWRMILNNQKDYLKG